MSFLLNNKGGRRRSRIDQKAQVRVFRFRKTITLLERRGKTTLGPCRQKVETFSTFTQFATFLTELQAHTYRHTYTHTTHPPLFSPTVKTPVALSLQSFHSPHIVEGKSSPTSSLTYTTRPSDLVRPKQRVYFPPDVSFRVKISLFGILANKICRPLINKEQGDYPFSRRPSATNHLSFYHYHRTFLLNDSEEDGGVGH